MGEEGTEYQRLPDRAGVASSRQKLSLVPLIFIIFYEVSGGPFGIEDNVRAAGPLLAIVGFLVLPIVWSVPEALITAELGTMFPESSGFVVWVASALGPYWGFQQGWMKWLSGVIDNALYPVLFLDYLKSGVPALGGGAPRAFAVVGLTAMLTLLNYRGLTVVGWVAIVLGVFSLLPFFVMGLIALPELQPARWLVVDIHNVNWNLYLNTLFWNLNYWDSVSTLSSEVRNPGKTLPKALFYAVIFVVVGYLYPLLAGTGAVPLDRGQWADGYFADIAKLLGGAWLMWWVQAAAAVSNMGLFVAGDEQRLVPAPWHGGAGHAAGLLRVAVEVRDAADRHPLLGLGRAAAVDHELPGDRGGRELPLLLWHADGVPVVRAAAGEDARCPAAVQGAAGHGRVRGHAGARDGADRGGAGAVYAEGGAG
jgi:hypothetical protein